MTSQDSDMQDIFKGAARIEIFGKLPSLLWAYIDAGRQLGEDLKTSPDRCGEGLDRMSRILEVLYSAAVHLGNDDLQRKLEPQNKVLATLSTGETPDEGLLRTFTAGLGDLEQIAGQRAPGPPAQVAHRDLIERELERLEKIKTGRSADIVVSVDLVNEIRDYLTAEVMTEGISSLLVIDDAGSLIVNVGHKIDLDAVSLAAVAAANFAATEQIARLIGEHDFVLLFYKGHNESFHFTRVGNEYIIVTIFSNALSLGLVRLRIAEVAAVLEKKLPKREV
jgi:predicted regulator of Ras-like GTPase activity (Roadblock/LC7/MglB family)